MMIVLNECFEFFKGIFLMGDLASAGLDVDNVKTDGAPFFVVSPVKLGVMTFFTFGLYWWYCFYQSWRLHKVRTGERVIPILRSAFGIFFIYPLLSRANDFIRESGGSYPWSILRLTLTYYALSIMTAVAGFFLDGHLATVLAVELILQIAWISIMVAMQKGINFSAGDASGESNSRFTLANWLWMIPGCVMELVKLYALFMTPLMA
ncbi:hypothetical protein NJF44_17915 [Pseudomonas guariconensis]|uniref:hypothetical protein n=1 Tax=Pseudomonas TaxID=286 RepID=UPI001CE3C81C|nr:MULTISPECIES: hypothetical protein [Pseudomonas]MCO7639940.1 hypothetical protein [Pseudomonas sp. S 311-6]MCO7515934.1 hypothetical protein [Pseudomonas putida]MCO7567473.1 hypothetical protein [Pseudomonas mosselii]MCO7594375.1 hypothetical protein [Pseudomonas guariconensis]MCO7607112.1 hypothetical protein [Pseudomonas guariconensis]